MIKLMRELLVILLLGVVSVGAFAQKRDKDKRPPKEKVVVVTNSNKDNRPPPRNSNQNPEETGADLIIKGSTVDSRGPRFGVGLILFKFIVISTYETIARTDHSRVRRCLFALGVDMPWRFASQLKHFRLS